MSPKLQDGELSLIVCGCALIVYQYIIIEAHYCQEVCNKKVYCQSECAFCRRMCMVWNELTYYKLT